MTVPGIEGDEVGGRRGVGIGPRTGGKAIDAGPQDEKTAREERDDGGARRHEADLTPGDGDARPRRGNAPGGSIGPHDRGRGQSRNPILVPHLGVWPPWRRTSTILDPPLRSRG